MKKLILLLLLMISCLHLKSQVVTAGTLLPMYVDISPDSLLNYTVTPYTNETFSVNIFGDASPDLEFTAHGAVSSGGGDAYIRVVSLNPDVYIRFGRLDSVYAPGSSSWNVTKVALPLNNGEQVNAPSAIWDNTMLYFTDHSGHDGGNKNVNDWIGTDKFLGLKYQNGASASYGWFRVQCVSEDSCYLKDYSAAGAVGITERSKLAAGIYPNPVNTCFYLRNIDPNTFDIKGLKLKDLFGREVQISTEMMNETLRVSLDVSLPAGCYILEYVTEKLSFSHKVIKLNDK
jgi:hypothetical protein